MSACQHCQLDYGMHMTACPLHPSQIGEVGGERTIYKEKRSKTSRWAPLLAGAVLAMVITGLFEWARQPLVKKGYGIAFVDRQRQAVFVAGSSFSWPSSDCVIIWAGWPLMKKEYETCGVMAIQRMDEPVQRPPQGGKP